MVECRYYICSKWTGVEKYALPIYKYYYFFFFKQKTAYEIKECDWSSDVCSSDLDERLKHLGMMRRVAMDGGTLH